jgi:hypothetical protein
MQEYLRPAALLPGSKALLSAIELFFIFFFFKFWKSVHHHTIQINHQLDATVSPVYYFDVYLQLNMLRSSSRPSPGAQQL